MQYTQWISTIDGKVFQRHESGHFVRRIRESPPFIPTPDNGLCKLTKFRKSEITLEEGGWVGWAQVSLGPKLVSTDVLCSYHDIVHVVVRPLRYVLSHYYLIVLSIHYVNDGFPKKVWIGSGWVGAMGGVSSIQFCVGIFGICLTLQSDRRQRL